jgi:hypothetical protein
MKMKSETCIPWAAFLLAVFLPCALGRAADTTSCEVSVAALSLPAGSDGMVNWRAADEATTPLQLSTRYFSERLMLPGNIIQFFKDPVPEGKSDSPVPAPLITMRIPPGTKLAFVVVWSEPDGNHGPEHWKGTVFRGEDWKASSMKVLNACSETIGIIADKKQIKLSQGSSMEFMAQDWNNAFPVKIYRSKPETKLVFSSTWRVSAGRRELCFIGSANGAVTLRSLMDLTATHATPTP